MHFWVAVFGLVISKIGKREKWSQWPFPRYKIAPKKTPQKEKRKRALTAP